MMEFVLERGNYWAIIGLMMIGLYVCFAATNLIKRLVGLSVFQTSIILFYITLGRVDGGTAPIYFGDDYPGGHGEGGEGAHGAEAAHGVADAAHTAPDAAHGAAQAAHGASDALYHGMANIYSNPLPHVLMLTAIVVGVATLSVGLAIVVRIREVYGTIEADEIREIDQDTAMAEYADEPNGAGPA